MKIILLLSSWPSSLLLFLAKPRHNFLPIATDKATNENREFLETHPHSTHKKWTINALVLSLGSICDAVVVFSYL